MLNTQHIRPTVSLNTKLEKPRINFNYKNAICNKLKMSTDCIISSFQISFHVTAVFLDMIRSSTVADPGFPVWGGAPTCNVYTFRRKRM